MKTIIILLSLLILSPAYAEWYCEKVASAWMEKGVMLQACGIGYGKDENDARLDAFNNAKKEFENICNADTNCANNVINIDPQRTACDKTEEGYTCHRLVYYHITEKKREVASVAPKEPTVIEVRTTEKQTVVNNTNNIVVHQHYNTVKQATFVGSKYEKFNNYLRTVNGVSIYETNTREQQGYHLNNPSESELNSAIKAASSSGGMKRIYIHRN